MPENIDRPKRIFSLAQSADRTTAFAAPLLRLPVKERMSDATADLHAVKAPIEIEPKEIHAQ